MHPETRRTTPPNDEVAVRASGSGLTPSDVRPAPILFGSIAVQNVLLEIARNRVVSYNSQSGSQKRLITSGICASFKSDRRHMLALDERFPASDELRSVLSELVGDV